ncbi:MAG: hypothetical protein QOK05_2611 [Chloroflexota bacterium]|nr:hypothetical protein [Chloroflexota bacterium]
MRRLRRALARSRLNMAPRRGTIVAFGVVAGLPALAIFRAEAWLVFAAAILALAVLTAWDGFATPAPPGFRATRVMPRPLSLGEREQVTVTVDAVGGAGLYFEIADHAPAELAPDRRVLNGRFDPAGRGTGHYTVEPPRRGSYAFGAVDVRCRRDRGLWWRQARLQLPEQVAVYPNTVAVRRHEMRLRRGLVPLTGARRAMLSGSATSLASLRDYLPGDDIRRINWTATARRDSPVTMEFEAERGQQLIVLVDTGRLMTAPAGNLTKLDHAVNAALLLGWVAQRQGDRVGLATFSDRVKTYLPPRPGQAQMRAMNEVLYRVRGEYTEPDFGSVLSLVATRAGRRSLVVVLTDLLEKESSRELVGHAVRLARRHLVLVVALTDPELLATRDRAITDADRAYQWAAAEDLLAARRESFEVLRRGGVHGLEARAGQLSPLVVERYLELKDRSLV